MGLIGATYKTWSVSRKTATANTAITAIVPPAGRRKTKVTACTYSIQTQAHSITFMTPLDKVTLKAAVAANGTTLLLSRMPGAYSQNAAADGFSVPSVANNNIASGDYIIYQLPDGNYELNTAGNSTLNANGTVTMTDLGTAASAGGIANNTVVWYMGVVGDTNPNTGVAHPQYYSSSANNTTRTLPDANATSPVLAETARQREPILIVSNNTNSAGTLEGASGIYGR